MKSHYLVSFNKQLNYVQPKPNYAPAVAEDKIFSMQTKLQETNVNQMNSGVAA